MAFHQGSQWALKEEDFFESRGHVFWYAPKPSEKAKQHLQPRLLFLTLWTLGSSPPF